MGKLSKTARASINAGEGSAKRTPVAWVFEHRVGRMQTKPWLTFYTIGEAAEYVARNPDRFYTVTWSETRRR